MRRLALALSVMTIAAAVVHCSKVTELVVVVDTDLAAGSEVDTVEVTVDGPQGRAADPKSAEVRTASSLPLTLGVAAGSNDDAEVVVVATAKKGGVPVARTEVIARMVAGESRLVQVSLCKACGLTCGKNLGTSAPEWNDTLPAANACATTFADAGGFDSGRVDGGDAGGVTDGGIEPAPPADCQNRCAAGSECTKGGGCRVVGAATCADPVQVGLDGGAFFGTVCTGDAGTYATSCGKPHYGYVFETANGGNGHGVKLSGVRTYGMSGGPLESSCALGGGCTIQGGGDVTKTYPDAPPGSLYGIGYNPNNDAGACQTFTLTFTAK